MRIFVKAKPGAKVVRVIEESTELFSPGALRRFTVSVKEPAKEGKANHAIEAALAEHLKIAPSRVRVVSGHASKEKVVEVS